MSPMTPPSLRAQTTSVVAVLGAARTPLTSSGDDFARALRQETVDRPAARPREVARPEREPYRPVDRPVSRPVVRDTTEAARSARADARRVDDRRAAAAAAGPTDRTAPADRTSRAARDASDRAGEPGSTASATAQPATGSPVTQSPALPHTEAGLSGSDLLGAALAAGDPGAGVGLLGSGADAAEMLVRGATVATPLDAAAAATTASAASATSAASAATGGGAVSTTDAASLLATGSVGTAPSPGGVAPGAGSAAIGSAVIGTGALGAGALSGAQSAAASALAAAATAAPATTSDDRAASATASALLATSAPTTQPGLQPAPVAAPVLPAEAAVLVPGALGGGSSAATGGGAGGSGSGGAMTEGMAPVTAPAPAAGQSGAFAQTLTGLSGAAATTATTAPSAAGPAAQPSFVEQVRGPVLALRTAAPGEHLLTLKVTPDNLGPVQVRAHIGPDGIRIELVGATDAAREGLRNLLTDLRRDLAGTGMNASLSLGSDSAPGGRTGQGAPGDLGSAGDGSAQARPGRQAAAAREVTTPDLPSATARPTSSGAHGVDILT